MFADDVTVIGVAGRSVSDRFPQWITDRDVDGFEHITDPAVVVWREFGITTQPAFTFINDDGTFESTLGAMGLESLTARIEELVET